MTTIAPLASHASAGDLGPPTQRQAARTDMPPGRARRGGVDFLARVVDVIDCRLSHQRLGVVATIVNSGRYGFGWKTLADSTWTRAGLPPRAHARLAEHGTAAAAALLLLLDRAQANGHPWTRPGRPLLPGQGGRPLTYQALHASSTTALEVVHALSCALGDRCPSPDLREPRAV